MPYDIRHLGGYYRVVHSRGAKKGRPATGARFETRSGAEAQRKAIYARESGYPSRPSGHHYRTAKNPTNETHSGRRVVILGGIALLVWWLMSRRPGGAPGTPATQPDPGGAPPPKQDWMLLTFEYQQDGSPVPCYVQIAGTGGSETVAFDPATCSLTQWLEQVSHRIAARYTGESTIYVEEHQAGYWSADFRSALTAAIRAAGVPNVEWVSPTQIRGYLT